MSEPPAEAEQRYDAHYLRDVTALGDARELTANRSIRNRSEAKLVAKGVRVDGSLYERLSQQPLARPIEECLTVADAVSPRYLRDEGEKLLDSSTGFALLTGDAASPRELLAALENAPLDDSLAVRLTVMRERRPEMLAHAIGMALLVAFLARRSGIIGEPLLRLAGAGLYHDIGEMHIDPELLAAKRPLTETEWRRIYAHPLVAFPVLQRRPSCAGVLAEAVAEHHERLDGSGYPRGLRGEELSRETRILAIAELAATFFARPQEAGALGRLAIALKMNHRRFDRSLSDPLIVLAQRVVPSAAQGDTPQFDDAVDRLRTIKGIFQDWRAVVAAGTVHGAAFDWVAQRVAFIERTLLEVGLDLMHVTDLAALFRDDPMARSELPGAARELAWLLEEVVHSLYLSRDAPKGGPLAAWAEQVRERLALK